MHENISKLDRETLPPHPQQVADRKALRKKISEKHAKSLEHLAK